MSKRERIRKFLEPYISYKVSKTDNSLHNAGFLFKRKIFNNHEIKSLFPNLEFPDGIAEKKSFLKVLFEKYSKISHNKKIEVRAKNEKHKIDYGLIDIRDPNELEADDPLTLKIEKVLKRIEQYIPETYTFTHFNVYLYSKCLTPRCLHIDSFKAKHLKAFIYLTNSTLEDGVYSYVPGSHRNKLINLFQFLLNNIKGSDLGLSSNDGTLYSINNCRKFTAEIGDMLISDQRGVHGDLPCTSSGSGKIVLVVNFMTRKS
tara:strand:- start:9476 stop:10252 length:777 start_codon:yes stop_codon:yes gene_type:complete